MGTQVTKKVQSRLALSILALAACSFQACSVFRSSKPVYASGGEISTVIVHQPINELQRDPVPGTVNDVWEEPMIDFVHVPGQLDPHGTFYIPAHRALVEIRPGRYQKVEFPDEYGRGQMLSPDDSVVTPQGLGQK